MSIPSILLAAMIAATLKEPIIAWVERLYERTGWPFLADTAWLDIAIVFGGLSIVFWPAYARLVRAQILSLREKEYIEAARALGIPGHSIALRHLLPNALGPVIVYMTFSLSAAMVLESSLSYLGIGVLPPQASWGNMISSNIGSWSYRPWLVAVPAITLAIATTRDQLSWRWTQRRTQSALVENHLARAPSLPAAACSANYARLRSDSMLIRQVETVLLTGPSTNDPFLLEARRLRSVALIEIHTDGGRPASARPTPATSVPRSCRRSSTFYRPILASTSWRRDIQTLGSRMFLCGNYWARVGLGPAVITGIEAALWDLKGKLLGLPVYELLGGAAPRPAAGLRHRRRRATGRPSGSKPRSTSIWRWASAPSRSAPATTTPRPAAAAAASRERNRGDGSRQGRADARSIVGPDVAILHGRPHG